MSAAASWVSFAEDLVGGQQVPGGEVVINDMRERQQPCRTSAFSSPLLTFFDHSAQVCHWPDLERSELHPRVFRHQLYSVIQVARFEQQKAANLLLGLRIWSVGHQHFAFLPSQ